jgi:hypothetical protein
MLLQNDNLRILVYNKTPDEDYADVMVNIVAGAEDITLTRFEFHKLLRMMEVVQEFAK